MFMLGRIRVYTSDYIPCTTDKGHGQGHRQGTRTMDTDKGHRQGSRTRDTDKGHGQGTRGTGKIQEGQGTEGTRGTDRNIDRDAYKEHGAIGIRTGHGQ